MIISIAPAHISLRMKGGISTFKIYGYVLLNTADNTIRLQPADQRKSPVMTVPRDEVESIEVNFDN